MTENKGFVYTDHSTAEIALAFVWLGLSALMSVLLEVVYLGTWITLPGGHNMAFPYPVLIAFFFNMVLTKTAQLWTERVGVVLIPLIVWILGFCTLTFWVSVSGDILVGSNPRSLALLAAGVAGGLWPWLKSTVAQ